MSTVHEQFSENFFKWESRGRGWQVFDAPVHPEPPFRPFIAHFRPETAIIADGRNPTFLSSFLRKLAPAPPPVIHEPEVEPEPCTLIREPLVEIQTSLPADLRIAKEALDQFIGNLSLSLEPLAFELLGSSNRVLVQFSTSRDDMSLVRRQLQAYFPEAVFQTTSGTLESAWESARGDDTLVVEFGLAREFMRPLATPDMDPFVGIVAELSELQPGEVALFQ